jgi:hypothetical protein
MKMNVEKKKEKDKTIGHKFLCDCSDRCLTTVSPLLFQDEKKGENLCSKTKENL